MDELRDVAIRDSTYRKSPLAIPPPTPRTYGTETMTKKPMVEKPMLLNANEAAALAGVRVEIFRQWEREGIVKREPIVGLKLGKFHRSQVREAVDAMRSPNA